jgi:Na+-driven multidrug efflux pump
VGTNLGAGQRDRAVRAAWIGAAIAAGLTELLGLWAAFGLINAAAVARGAWFGPIG